MGLLYSSKIIYYQSIKNYQENINGKQQAKGKMLKLDVLGRFSLSRLMWIENEASFEVYASVLMMGKLAMKTRSCCFPFGKQFTSIFSEQMHFM